MRISTAAKKLNILPDSEIGVSLIETLIALALLSLTAVVFLSGLSITSKVTFINDERATAESLVRSQMEYVKTLDYVYNATEYPPAPVPDSADYANYSVIIYAEPLHDTDNGIQKVTIRVKHNVKSVLILDGFKVDR